MSVVGPVAQWIERLRPKEKVVRSTRTRVTIFLINRRLGGLFVFTDFSNGHTGAQLVFSSLSIIIINMQDELSSSTPSGALHGNEAVRNKKKIAIIVAGGAIIALVAVVLVALFLVSNNSLPNYDEAEKVEALLKDEEATPSTIMAELDYILEEKGVSEYINHFQTVIDSTNDDELKAEYYLARAGGLYDYGLQNGDLDAHREQILIDAKKAEELAPSIGSAYALYVYEDAFGESELAAYYEGLFDKRSAEGIDAED